jgi:hypothetical protein
LGKVKHVVSLSTRVISVLGVALIGCSLPLCGQIPPILKIADDVGDSVIIDSTGVPTGTGSFSTSSVSSSSGFISWSGTIGGYALTNVKGETKPLLTPPSIDVGIGLAVNNGVNPGVVTVSFTDTYFTASGPETLSILGTGATFSSYIDTTNAPFGMNTPVGSVSPGSPVTNETVNVIPAQTTRVSMTVVVTIPLSPGGVFIDDFALLAATPPLALACPATTGQVGIPYSSSLVANGGVPPYTYSILSGSLPPGLSLNPTTGAISGTPTMKGSYPFVAQVMDSSGGTANTVTANCGGIAIGDLGLSLFCASATTGAVGTPFNSSLTAIGGVTPYTFSLNSGSLPPGLLLNSATGAITGTPTTPGNYPFVAKIVDVAGDLTTAQGCGISIAPLGLSVLCPTVTTGSVGLPYSSSSVAAGGTPPYMYSIFSGSLPPGLTLNPTTGAITGTPTAANSYPFVVEVTDSAVPMGTAFSSSCGISIGAPTTCLTRYAANLQIGESYINITNTGANGASLLGPGFGAALGNICVNAYTFDQSEELVSCCSCLVTPDQTVNLGVVRDLTSKTVTGIVPTSVTVKLCATLTGLFGEDTNCGNTAATVSSSTLVGGIAAWGTTLHATPTSGYFDTTGTPFTPVSSGTADLASISGRCASIIGNASGFGICSSCRAGALGGQKF